MIVLGGYAPSLIGFRGSLLRALREEGCIVDAVAAEADEPVARQLAEWGIRYHALAMARTGFNPFGDIAYCIRLRKLFIETRPDVVLAYTHKPVVYAALAAATVARPLCVYALITGLGYAFSRGGGLRQRIGGGVLRTLYRQTAGRFSGMMFQNADDQRLFRGLGLVDEGTPTIVVRGSGIDLAQFAHEPLARGGDGRAGLRTAASGDPLYIGPTSPSDQVVRFLLIARLLGDKGIREYVAAGRLLRGQHQAVELHLVGPRDSNPSAIPAVELDAWQRDGAVILHPAMADVRPALRNCTVYVLPSYREGTPRTVLEAMAIGRPVITTDAPGCRDTVFSVGCPDRLGVREGLNGFLVPARSVVPLARAMQRFVEDSSLAHRMGQIGRRLAEEYYDVRKVNSAMLRFMDVPRGIPRSVGGTAVV